MSTKINIFVLCAIIVDLTDAAKILAVFPVPSISHQIVFRPLTLELAKRGHTVTVITPDPAFPKDGAPPNLTEIDVHNVSYKIWIKKFVNETSKGIKSTVFTQVKVFLATINKVFDAQLHTAEIREILSLRYDTFDLLLLENGVRPALAFSYAFKAPVILVTSVGPIPNYYNLVGASEHPLLYPTCIHQRIYNLTLWEKIKEIYLHYRILKLFGKNSVTENYTLRKYFGSHIPSVYELSNNVDMLLLNTNPAFVDIRPVPPNVIYVGGLHQSPAKPLSADLQQYLDSSKHGVVYVSFGTNVDPTLLPAEKVRTIVSVLSKLPYDVLFKWNSENLPGRTNNIKISKWLPQSDLLKHPKIKVFITQGGLQSTDEAITAGVPLIGIPMLGDQWYNVEHYVHHRIGVQLDLETLTERQLMDAITTVVGDESYRNNIIKLRTRMQDQPMKPLERAVWWTEYVIRHGGAKHLRDPAANISWTQYLELELVLTLLAALLCVIAIFSYGTYLLYKYISSVLKSKKSKQKLK